jgi:hypothetical protein
VGGYKDTSTHASPSNGYRIHVEQMYGEHGITNKRSLMKNAIIAIASDQANARNTSTNCVKIPARRNNCMDCVDEDTSASIESASRDNSDVRSPGSCASSSTVV